MVLHRLIIIFLLILYLPGLLANSRHWGGPKRKGGDHIQLLVIVDSHISLLIGCGIVGKGQPARSI
jgi:hypothetical protein